MRNLLCHFLSVSAGMLLVAPSSNAQALNDSQRQSQNALIESARLLTDAAAVEARHQDAWEPKRA